MTLLRTILRPVVFVCLFALVVFTLAGCGGGGTPAISVSVSPATVTLIGGGTQTFTATVSNDSTNSGVTWAATTGSITSGGVYTAPAVVTTTSATITATSVHDGSKTGTATVTLTPISVAVLPTTATLIGGATQQFTATVTADGSSSGVTWSATIGSISTSGLYTAPAVVTTTTATITATSVKDTTKTATATVTLTPISVSVSPTTATLIGGATQQFAATVTADGSSSGVTWTATTGSISTSGLYTAPAVIGSTLSATITATSVKDPTKNSTATVTLTPISVNAISPATASLGVGGTQAFTVTVANDGSSSGVTWSIGSGAGSLTSVTTTGVTYNAPTTAISTVTTVTLTATSIKDTTKSTTATITLNPLSVSIPTTPVAMIGGATQSFSATVTNDSTNSGVNWTVTSGGGSFSPTTTLSGVNTTYTAASPVTTTTAVLTATSVKDTTKTASVTVTLTPIAVSFGSTTSATLDAGQQYSGVAATISNDSSNSGITFTVATGGGDIGSSSTTSTTISGAGPYSPVYYSPASVPTQTTTTITAASVKDPTKTATFTVTLNPAMAWTTPSSNTATLTAATTNTSYSYTFAVSGGTGTKSYTVVSGSLPTGLSLSSAGVISGSPTTAGSSTFGVRATDQSSNPSILSGTFTIVVTVTPLAWTTPSTTTTLPTETVGTAITSYTLAATGGQGTLTYSINSGTLPTGLSLSSSTGIISGTPTQPTIVAGNAVTFKVTDSATPTPNTLVSSAVTFIANPVTLVISTPTLPAGYVGSAYNTSGYQFASTGGTGTITWTMSPTNVVGLTLSTSGLLSGTPSGTYSSTISVTATDSATNQQQVKNVTPTLTINPVISTTTTLSPGSSTIVAGTSITLTATVSPQTGSTTPTGTVSFYNGSTLLGTSNLSSGVATLATTALPVGINSNVHAVYNGSSSNATSTSSSSSITVNQATTTTVMSASPTTATAGANVTLTATVSNTVSTPITGTVSFYYNSSTLLGSSSVSSGVATLITIALPLGTDGVYAVYNGDAINATSTSSTSNVTITAAYSITGNVGLVNNCNSSSLPTFTITLKQGTSTVQTVTTDSSGNYTLSNVVAGSYTIVPSITGPSSAFYPSTQSVTVSSSSLTSENFSTALGYTVSGTISYSGSMSGPIYISLSGGCGGGNNSGTAITAAGSYTINGVLPGSYTLSAYKDAIGLGVQNIADPVPTATAQVTVSTSNVTGASLTIADPTVPALSSGPTLQGVAAFNNGVLAQFKPVKNSNGIETASSYTLQWSTSSSFSSITGHATFKAFGTGGANIWLLGNAMAGSNCTGCSTLTNGSMYYFRAYATNSTTAQSSYGVFNSSGTPIPVTINAPSGNAYTASGSVTFSNTPTGPLYVGFYDYSAGRFYGEYFQNPASAQAFSINLPASSTYYFVGILDQNQNGYVDTGDLANVNGNIPTQVITGNTSGLSLTLPGGNSNLFLVTVNNKTYGVTGNSYTVAFGARPGVKLPIALQLTSASAGDIPVPKDISICTSCGSYQFQGYNSTASTIPLSSNVYGFKVTYSDTTTDTTPTLTGATVLNAFATSPSPSTGTSTSTTPTFTWTYPTSASSYTYQFWVCCSSNSDIWDIPGPNSNGNGFTSSQIAGSIVWGTDPTDSTNTPSISALSTSTSYQWNIQTTDANNNESILTINYQP